MSATLGLLDAIAGRPAKQPQRGAHRYDTDCDGVPVGATYDLEGVHMPATEVDPAEHPEVVLRSILIADVELFGADADAWDERLAITDAIYESELDR